MRYHALEMAQLHKALKNGQEKFNLNYRFILGFNDFTNQHGQSWTRPLLLIGCVVTVVFFPIKILLGFNHLVWANTVQTLSELVESFNPVRKFTESFGLQGKVNGTWQVSLAKVLDIIFLRLGVGLLGYQMLRAFRKYVR